MDATLRGYGAPKVITQIFEKKNATSFLELFDKTESPRVFKTHLFMDFLPSMMEKGKVSSLLIY